MPGCQIPGESQEGHELRPPGGRPQGLIPGRSAISVAADRQKIDQPHRHQRLKPIPGIALGVGGNFNPVNVDGAVEHTPSNLFKMGVQQRLPIIEEAQQGDLRHVDICKAAAEQIRRHELGPGGKA